MAAARKHRYAVEFWSAVAVTLVVLALLLHSDFFKHWIDQATEWAEGIMKPHPVQGGVIFFLFSAGSAMLAFTSSVVLVPPANLVWGKAVTFLLLWGGWTAGAMAAFAIGKLAEPFLLRHGYRETLRKYQQFVSKRMKFWAVLVFCIAVPSEVPGYVFGSMKYPFWKFVAAIAIAEGLYGIGVIVAGDSLVDAKPGVLFMAIGAMIAVAVIAGFVLRHLKRRRALARTAH